MRPWEGYSPVIFSWPYEGNLYKENNSSSNYWVLVECYANTYVNITPIGTIVNSTVVDFVQICRVLHKHKQHKYKVELKVFFHSEIYCESVFHLKWKIQLSTDGLMEQVKNQEGDTSLHAQ